MKREIYKERSIKVIEDGAQKEFWARDVTLLGRPVTVLYPTRDTLRKISTQINGKDNVGLVKKRYEVDGKGIVIVSWDKCTATFAQYNAFMTAIYVEKVCSILWDGSGHQVEIVECTDEFAPEPAKIVDEEGRVFCEDSPSKDEGWEDAWEDFCNEHLKGSMSLLDVFLAGWSSK
jgi:hypothetical protein